MLKSEIESIIFDMEKVARLFEIEPFDIYLLGGVACILGDYSTRGTRDFDFIDLGYDARLGRVFSLMRDFDMLDYETAVLSPFYMKRSKKLEQFKYLNIYILSLEDIIVSKIIRLEAKDIEDIDTLIFSADKTVINSIIGEVLKRSDLLQSKKKEFEKKLRDFRSRYNV